MPDNASVPQPTQPSDEFLGHLLMQAGLRLRAATAQSLGGLGLAPREFGLLNQIVHTPGLTQAQLGAALGMDRTTIVALLDHLENAGWTVRTPDAADRRAYRLHATPAGLAHHARAEAQVRAAEHAFVEPLDAALADALKQSLRGLKSGTSNTGS